MFRYIALLAVALSVQGATVTLSTGVSCQYSEIVITPDAHVRVQCGAKAANCEEMVTGLYRELLKREPDVGGLEFWSKQCKAGMTEQQMRIEFEPYRLRG